MIGERMIKKSITATGKSMAIKIRISRIIMDEETYIMRQRWRFRLSLKRSSPMENLVQITMSTISNPLYPTRFIAPRPITIVASKKESSVEGDLNGREITVL
jgi:hypothetical protein